MLIYMEKGVEGMSIYDNSIVLHCIEIVAIVIIGYVLASFLNRVAWCIAHEIAWTSGCKFCTNCGHILKFRDDVSISIKGTCQYCKAKLSVGTPFVEILFVILAVFCVLQYDVTPICLRNLILLSVLYCLSLVDLQCYIIPDRCLLLALLAWVGAIPFAPESYGGVFGILCSIGSALLYGGGLLAFSLLMDHVLQKESMGGGDIKLFFVMGLYLGIVASLFAMFFACMFGLCFALPVRNTNTKQIPFGPSIAMAFWLVLLYGQPLIDWYTGLIRL